MSIALESEESELRKLRERVRQMSDEELVKLGKLVRGLSAPRVGGTPDPWKAQLQLARAEWRRWHPKSDMTSAQNEEVEPLPPKSDS